MQHISKLVLAIVLVMGLWYVTRVAPIFEPAMPTSSMFDRKL